MTRLTETLALVTVGALAALGTVYVIDRDPDLSPSDDAPGFDCRTMGNGFCGGSSSPAVFLDLPGCDYTDEVYPCQIPDVIGDLYLPDGSVREGCIVIVYAPDDVTAVCADGSETAL